MGREVERKYLVRGDGWRAKAGAGVPYRQGYISTDPDRSVRIRIAGDNAFLTIKGKAKGGARDEFEYPIPPEDARQMLRTLCRGPVIEKQRYVIHDGPFKWEIDEFEGDNRGLVLAEVETEAPDVPAPEWAGEEVTGDPRYFNLNLIERPFNKWKK